MLKFKVRWYEMIEHNYPDPVCKLLTYGKCKVEQIYQSWPDYTKLGLTEEHIPDLIRMAIDDNLHYAEAESVEIWAPVHAWRTLGQFGAKEAAQPLVRLYNNDEDHDQWLSAELPVVFSMIGEAALPALEEFLRDNDVDVLNRIGVPECLERIARDHPDCRQRCNDILSQNLERYETNNHGLNAFLILSLVKLKAIEAIDLIRASYAADCVEIDVLGDVEDAEIIIGIRKTRSTPEPHYHLFPGMPQLDLQHYNHEFRGRTIPATLERRAKAGRNEPCPCGSGKKYKKCCLH